MNGFHLLNKYDPGNYIQALESSIPYMDEGNTCLDVEYKDREFGIVFLSTDQLPSLERIESIIAGLIEMDSYVAGRETSRTYFLETESEFEFSYVEISKDGSMSLYYCGVNVNTQWSAEFAINDSGNWRFSGLS